MEQDHQCPLSLRLEDGHTDIIDEQAMALRMVMILSVR